MIGDDRKALPQLLKQLQGPIRLSTIPCIQRAPQAMAGGGRIVRMRHAGIGTRKGCDSQQGQARYNPPPAPKPSATAFAKAARMQDDLLPSKSVREGFPVSMYRSTGSVDPALTPLDRPRP